MISDDNCRCHNCIAEEVIAESAATSVDEVAEAVPKQNWSWIGVDLDGTLAFYDKWVAADHIGDPIWPMVERVRGWLAAGRRVKIMTARAAGPYEPKWLTRADIVHAIEQWCLEYIGQKLEVTNEKDMYMIELWDDRAVQVEPNVGEPVAYWSSRVE